MTVIQRLNEKSIIKSFIIINIINIIKKRIQPWTTGKANLCNWKGQKPRYQHNIIHPHYVEHLQTTVYYVQIFLCVFFFIPLAVEKDPSGGDRSIRTAGLPKRWIHINQCQQTLDHFNNCNRKNMQPTNQTEISKLVCMVHSWAVENDEGIQSPIPR